MEHAEDSYGDELANRLDADIDLERRRLGRCAARRRAPRGARPGRQLVHVQLGLGAAALGRAERRPFFLNQARLAGHVPAARTWAPDLVGGGVFGGGTFLHPNFDIVSNYQATIDLYGNGSSNDWVPLAERDEVRRSNPGSPGAVSARSNSWTSTEDTDAAYVMFKFGDDETKLGNITVKGNIGVRYVDNRGGLDRRCSVPALHGADPERRPGPAGSDQSVPHARRTTARS